uniref:F-box domain-containing protein n=1 Tax=Aegilops tauschii subsp. strangulata TaxID=200361 RepID=A0A453L5C3_AEGTS
MGLMALNRLISRQREQKQKRNRGRIEANNGWIASSLAKRNRSPCRQDINSHGGKKVRYPGPDLPEDIWRHIHFLLPMQDAARAARISQSFRSSWKCYPNLTFTNETMCSKEDLCMRTTGSNVIRDYNNKIDHVLRNHSGAGVKKLRLEYYVIPHDAEPYHHLTSWLQIAVTPGIEQLHLTLSPRDATFNFPCMLLSERCHGSIQYLHLANLDLHPTFQLGLRTLKTLHLYNVHITGGELGCLLSHSFALAHLRLQYCHDIIRLQIPCLLQRLRFLEVLECSLEVLEINAPNISRFRLMDFNVQLSFGKSRKMKNLMLNNSCGISYAIDNLPSCAPKVETLTIHSSYEIINAPVTSSKFRHLKILIIYLLGLHSHRDYDYLSLVSLFDASPLLERFVLFVSHCSPCKDYLISMFE